MGLLALGGALRFWRLDLGWFGVDQARDVQTALDIAAGHDWPTVGPTMRRVTSLGALYHYVWALPSVVSADPLAHYRFAAGLGVVTLVGAWMLARRWWGARAALVALAVLATSRIAVIDGRIAWAPAALPAIAILLLGLLAGPVTASRLALLGAALGLAVQLHLTMAAWVVAAVVLVVGRRPTLPALGAGVLAGCVAGGPAMYAALANAGQDAGLATLPARGPLPNVVTRLLAAATLEWRVPSAFWQWPDTPDAGRLVTRVAAAVVSVAILAGLGRLATARHRDRLGTVVLAVTLCQLGMVVLLPGDAWYYYLDALLPVAALAAGALVAPRGDAPARVSGAIVAVVVAAGLLLALHSARWLAATAHHGYLTLQPAALALDGAGGRDAAVAGRLLAVGVKRDVAAILATERAPFPALWRSVHGPAFDDVTGDNGFWLARASATAPTAAVAPARHAAVWYRDDPAVPTVAVPGVELVDVGPLRIARYVPAIAYEACRTADGPITVPLRVVPAPRHYGDGTIARTPVLPSRLDCAVTPGTGGTRVVAAVSAGTVVLRDAAGTTSPAGPTTSLCLRRGGVPAPFAITITVPPGTPSDLDLYERPDPDCTAGKIAP